MVFFLIKELFSLYLKSKLVKEVVDEVFNAADDAVVQMLLRDIVENNPGSRRRQFVPHPVVFLMAVDGHLKRQQTQHQQIVLPRENRVLFHRSTIPCRAACTYLLIIRGRSSGENVRCGHPEVVQQVIGLHQAHPVCWFHRFLIQQRLIHFILLGICVIIWLWTENMFP